MKIRVLIIALIFLIFYTYVNAYESDFYPKSLMSEMEKVVQLPNEQNLDKLYQEFIKFKGLEDETIAYAIVEALLNHPTEINEKTILIAQKFSPKNKDKIGIILSDSIILKIINSHIFFNKFAVYTFLKYTSSIFILLVFLYLLFKNYFIFFHSHKFNLKAIGFAKLIIFLLLTIVISITFNNYLFVILAGFTILLLIPENIASKTAVILFLSVFSILNSIDYNKNELQKNKYLEIINKPVSKNYIERYLEKSTSPFTNIIATIKYPELSEKNNFIRFTPKNKFEAANYAIYLLITEKVDEFNSLAEKFNLTEDPIIMINVASFYSKKFNFEKYEDIIKNLYTFYPEYHKLLQNLQLNLNTYVFLPYNFQEGMNKDTLTLNYTSVLIFFILLAVGIIINRFFYNFRLFKCIQCGESFCIKCDDGYLHGNICEKCRIFSHKIAKADASTLVMQQFQIEKYKRITKFRNIILMLIAPGADRLFINQPVVGLILTALHSILIFILIFQTVPFISPTNIGFQFSINYLYYSYICLFLLIYIANMLIKRDNNGI
ncbi:MAG: hypothetical protein JG762_292 [Deferribacteraceae bacterium]|jgi:hypothetical protein|nr:hypothetical protein [Deferribacteraceae bacterium]